MRNLGQMMKQAQEMQAKMAEMQNRMGEIEATGQSGAGMVTATVNGKGELKALRLDKSIVSPDDSEMLEDLIVAAFNDAKGKVDQAIQEETNRVMGGLKLPPGFKLPF